MLAQSLRRLHIEHNHLAVKQLRKDVAKVGFVPADEHIFAMAFLAFQSGDVTISEEPYPHSPMADLNSYYRLSQFDHVQEHALAIRKCVAIKGGIETIKLPSLDKTLLG
jgi:hypothetical protein